MYGAARLLYYKRPELFLCLLIFINFEFFLIIPPIGKFSNYRILLLPIIFFLIAEIILFRRIKIGKSGLLVAAYMMLLGIGILTAFSNGQSLSLGVKAVKFQLPFLVYFIVVSQDIELEKFSKYVIVMSFLLSVLVILNIYAFNGKLFAEISEERIQERLGIVRFTVGEKIISVACIMAFIKFLRGRSISYLILFLVIFCHLFFVVQTRMIILGVIISCFIVFSFCREPTINMIISMIVIISFMIPCGVLFSQKLTKIGLVNSAVVDVKEKKNNFQGRITTYKYYISKIAESPLWGYGHENINWEKSNELDLMERGIHKTDIGITHFFYENGVFLGMAWFIIMTYLVIRMSWPLRKLCPEILSYFLLAYSTIVTLDYLFHSKTILLLGMFLGLLEQFSARYNSKFIYGTH